MSNKPRFYYDNILTRRDSDGVLIAVIDASTTASGDFDADNVRDWRRYTRWKQGLGQATSWVRIDAISAVTVDTIILYGHNLNGVDVDLQWADAAGGPWTNFVVQFTPTDDKLILKEIAVGVSHRYWRAFLTANGNEPEFGIFYVGPRLEFPIFLLADFNPKPFDVDAQQSRTVEGHYTGVNVDWVKLNWSITFFPLSNTFVDATGQPSLQDWIARCVIRREPLFWAWQSDIHPDEVYFVICPLRYRLNTSYDRNSRRFKVQLQGKTEDFET